MRVSGPDDRCNELLTESGCVRALGHRPPHTAEVRYADLLDERDELADLVASDRGLLEALRAARQAGLIPFYALVPVAREALEDGVDVADFVASAAADAIRDNIRRWHDDAR
jgi:hypothetical protein